MGSILIMVYKVLRRALISVLDYVGFHWERYKYIRCNVYISATVRIVKMKGCTLQIERGSSIGHGSLLYISTQDGKNAALVIGHNTAINEYNNIRATGGSIYIGNYCQIAEFCTLVASNHEIETEKYMVEEKWNILKTDIVIEDDVWIGANAVILPGVKVGKGAVVGAGSVVTRNVEPFSIVGGNPARIIRMRKKYKT
jgi:acetyltransferase-like isoleucine patch superfamily enzyme